MPRPRSPRTLAAGLTLAALITTGANADVLVEYDYTGPTFGPKTGSVVTGASATAFTNGPGINTPTEAFAISTTVGNPTPSLRSNGYSGSTLANAITNGDYVQFQFTPPSAGVDLDSIDFQVTSDATTGDRLFFLHYSFDNFTTSTTTAVTTDVATANVFQSFNRALTNQDTILGKTTSTVTFRFFGTTGGNNLRNLFLDNIVLNGTVIPEPASLALVGLAALVALPRRRR